MPSGKPMPTKPPVAMVLPDLINRTASRAVTTLPTCPARRDSSNWVVSGSMNALVAMRSLNRHAKCGDCSNHVKGRGTGRIRAIRRIDRPRRWQRDLRQALTLAATPRMPDGLTIITTISSTNA